MFSCLSVKFEQCFLITLASHITHRTSHITHHTSHITQPPPIHSHPPSADALWAGVPIITLPGHHMAARVASSIVSLHLRKAPALIRSLFVVRNFDECVNVCCTHRNASPSVIGAPYLCKCN